MSHALNNLYAAALLPLIAPQGLYVRYRASRMDPPEGPTAGQSGNGPPLRLLILGDSSAASVGVSKQSEGLAGQCVRMLQNSYTVTWHQLAQSGATSACISGMLPTLGNEPFDIVVTGFGVNDVKNGVRLKTWERSLGKLYAQLTQDLKARLIVASGMPPVSDFPLLPNPLRWALQQRANLFDASHRRIAAQVPQVRYLPGPPNLDPAQMSADGFHPGPAVYADWARRVVAVIRQEWAAEPKE